MSAMRERGWGEGRTAKETFFVLVCHSGLAGGIWDRELGPRVVTRDWSSSDMGCKAWCWEGRRRIGREQMFST